MNLWSAILPLLLLAGGSGPAPASESLACRRDALKPAQRDRHHLLTGRIREAVAGTLELADGFELALDFSRLPLDSTGEPFCIVEVAEWVDLESRCCPFLNFEIGLGNKGRAVTLRLTGATGVKAFVKDELVPASPAPR